MSAKNGKPCPKCGGNEWYASGGCAACQRERSRQYREANPEKVREAVRRWVAKKPEKARENHRLWIAKNPDRARENRRQWHEANPDRERENGRRWRANNPDKDIARQHRRRTRKTQAGGSYTAAEWKALCKQYGNKCLYPGCERTDLTADHVIPVSKGGSSNIDNIQCLCGPHNSSKGDKIIDYRTRPGIKRWIQRKLFG